MNSLSETDRAYIAGFIDGEGCITILKNKKGKYSSYYALTLTIAQADKLALEDLSAIIGGGKIYKSKSTDTHFLTFAPNDSIFLLKEIRPYLRYKKDQADLAIEFREKTTFERSGQKLDDDVSRLREYYFVRMKELKRNGLSEKRGRKSRE